MSQPVKTLLLLLIGLLVIVPALALVCLVVGVSVVFSGTMDLAAGMAAFKLTLGLLAAAIILALGLLLGFYLMHFRRLKIHYHTESGRKALLVKLDVRGCTVYRHVWAKILHERGQDRGWVEAISRGVDAYFEVDMRDYLMTQIEAQYGLNVSEAMRLADATDFHFSL